MTMSDTMTNEEYRALVSRQRTARRQSAHNESTLQQACVHWFRTAHPGRALLLFAVPNGGFRIAREAARMYAEGVVAGVSDLIYLEPRGSFGALCIEMKTTAKASRQSSRQIEWQQAAERAGNRYVVCRTFDEFRQAVEEYLALPSKAPRIDEVEF